MRRYKAYGKCLLAGEYAVLFGGAAVVCPLKTAVVVLERSYTRPGIWVKTQASPDPYPYPDQIVIADFLAEKGFHLQEGVLLTLALPIQSRLGSSAASAGVCAQAFHHETGDDVFSMAQGIEQRFHGISSGADVAGSLADGPLFYTKSPLVRRPLATAWQPLLGLSSAGSGQSTRLAVEQFLHLKNQDRQRWAVLNGQMHQAALDVAESLQDPQGYALLKDAFGRAKNCFEAWGAIPPFAHTHMMELLSMGAAAVKPTGSGHGGMVLSLWQDRLPQTCFPLQQVDW